MFGLEKNSYKPFEFDLEKELKKDKKKVEQTRKLADGKINQIKEILRKSEGESDFENLGVILHGFTALEKVLDKIEHQPK